MQSQKTHENPVSIVGKRNIAIVHLAFFLLFPGFFIYQTLLGIGAIGAFLGGYFSITSIALILPLIFIYLFNIKRLKNFFSTTDLYFFIFIFYFFFVIVINFFAGANTIIARNHLLSIIYFLNIFIIFKMIEINDNKLKIISISILLTMSVIIFLFSIDGSFDLASLGAAKYPEIESVATYQGFARSYLLTFIVSISTIKSKTVRFLMYIIAASALFLNGARSEFVAMLFLIPIIEIYYSENKLHSATAIFAFFAITTLSYKYISEYLPKNRIMELTDLSQSTSAIERRNLTYKALQTISEHPILGDYASYPAGDYTHNILSAWVDLGLFGFIFLLAILILSAMILFFDGFFLKTKSSDFLLSFSLICVTILLVFTSKTFDDMIIGAALGAYSKYKFRKNMSKITHSN